GLPCGVHDGTRVLDLLPPRAHAGIDRCYRASVPACAHRRADRRGPAARARGLERVGRPRCGARQRYAGFGERRVAPRSCADPGPGPRRQTGGALMSRHEHLFVDASGEALGRGREILDRSVLALPFYQEAHARLAGEIEAWCERHAPLFPSVEADLDVDATGRDLVRALGADGWFRHFQSGHGGDFRSICLVREALAYACDLADFAFSIQALSATPVMRYGNEAQRQRYLPAMAAGTLLGSFAISEPDAGSDVAAIKLRADRTAS